MRWYKKLDFEHFPALFNFEYWLNLNLVILSFIEVTMMKYNTNLIIS